MKLDNKVAIVTGSARGIGKAIAMKFAAEGASVVVNSRNIDEINRVVAEIKSLGGTAIGVKADVSSRAEVQELVQTTIDTFKAIHILVNNAGMVVRKILMDTTEEEWDALFTTNLKSVFHCTKAVLVPMMAQRYGKIINISSTSGVSASFATRAGYGATKAGIIRLTQAIALDAGQYGINVNCIAPGQIVTEMTYSGWSKEEAEKFIEAARNQTSLGRVGKPEYIANLALFLASEDSSWITGQTICCDGGRHDRF